MNETLPGFQDSGAQILIKLGGSLLFDLNKCRLLAKEIDDLSKKYKIVIFPGGGPIDKYIEDCNKELHFPPFIHHQLCARAQDQTGLIFGSLCSNARFFSSLVELRPLFEARHMAIMLPMKMIVELDIFEKSWRITSDTMAAYFANLLSVNKISILKSVDGLYKSLDNKIEGQIKTIAASDLSKWRDTIVDECLCPFLLNKSMSCCILNGYNIDAVSEWIKTGKCAGTTILPR